MRVRLTRAAPCQPRLTRFMSKATSTVCGITMLTPLCGGISGLVTALSYGGPGIAVWGWCARSSQRTPRHPANISASASQGGGCVLHHQRRTRNG